LTYSAKTRSCRTGLESDSADAETPFVVPHSGHPSVAETPSDCPVATGLHSKRSHPFRKPRSTTVRVTKPVALGPLHPRASVPFGRTTTVRGTLQPTLAAHTILFSMTSTRVLCGYLPWSPTSGDSPLHASETLRRVIVNMKRASYSRLRPDGRTSDAPSPPTNLPRETHLQSKLAPQTQLA